MRPGKNLPTTPEFTAPQVPAEHDFLIPQVYEAYCRKLPEFISEFSDEQLIGRANNVRYQTPLLQYEDGFVSHRVVSGMFEPHIAQLVRSEALLDQRSNIFNRLVSDGVEPVEAEKNATRAANLMAISMVEKAHDPAVQAEIRKELLYRADIAVAGAPAGFERFKAVVAGYKSTNVQNPWEVSKELFSRFQAQGRRVPPESRGRHFDLMVALGSATDDTRSLIAEIDGNRVATTLQEAKMRLVFALHSQEVAANMRLGRKLDLTRIREKFQPLYDKLGYEYQDPSLSVQPSRVREGAMVTGLALRAGRQAVGNGVGVAARVTVENVEQAARVTGVGMLGLGLLSPLVSHAPSIPERPMTSVSQLEIANKLPTIDLNAENTAFSAMPTAFEASAALRAGEKCADPFKYTDAMKQAVDRIIARGGHWGRQGIVLDFFLEHCEGINASSGIVGNSEAESGTNPNRHQVQGSAFGVFQHDGNRKQQLMSIPGYQKLSTQLQFSWNEMLQGSMVDNLQRATSPEDGAAIFERLFERAGVKRLSVREGSARDIYREYLKEYRVVLGSLGQASAPRHATPSPQHVAPQPRASHSSPVAPPRLNFSNAISESIPGEGPAINPADHLGNKDQDASVRTHATALMTSIEAALASNNTTSENGAPAADVPASPVDRGTVGVSRSATRKSLDFTGAIEEAIASRDALSVIPAALTTESPTAITPSTPEHTAAALALQAALAAPHPHVEQAPLPSASSALDALPSPSLPDLQPPISPAHTSPATPVLPDISPAPAITHPIPDAITPTTPEVQLTPSTVTTPQPTPNVDSSPSLLDSAPVTAQPSSPSGDSSLVSALPASPDTLTPQPGSGGILDVAPALPDVPVAPQPPAASPVAPALPPIVLAPTPSVAAPTIQAPVTPARPALPHQKPTPERKSNGTKADIAKELGIANTDLRPANEGMYLSPDAYKQLGFDAIRQQYRQQYPKDHTADKNGMYTGQCVSWTGFRIDNDRYSRLMPNWGGRGDAYQWMQDARQAGIEVNRTPAVGAAMEWYKSPGHSDAGHSAYVEGILSDGSVLITEYNNIGPSLPSARVITPEEIKNNHAIRFLHFEK